LNRQGRPIAVINFSPGDLAPVFDAMLEEALSLWEASFGIMSTSDGKRASFVSQSVGRAG
jgi:hypothetical protein